MIAAGEDRHQTQSRLSGVNSERCTGDVDRQEGGQTDRGTDRWTGGQTGVQTDRRTDGSRGAARHSGGDAVTHRRTLTVSQSLEPTCQGQTRSINLREHELNGFQSVARLRGSDSVCEFIHR